MQGMKRKIEDVINAWASSDDTRPLLIQGARRVGKTFIIEKVCKSLPDTTLIKLDFQTDLERMSTLFSGPSDDVNAIVSRIGEYKRTSLDPARTILFFDEVQLCEKALNSLRFFEGSAWRVIASGSLFGVTIRNRKLPFPSGLKHVTMHPMDFEEFLWALGHKEIADAIREHARSGEPYVLHEEALQLYHRYLVVGGMPKSVRSYRDTGLFELSREALEEIDITYTADMTDPDNGISAAAAKRIWNSIPKQLLRSSTKKFKYSDVMRGGRRTTLLEPLEWLIAAGIVMKNELTCDTVAPLAPFNDEEGSYFKIYLADTGLMFYKFNIDPEVFLDPSLTSLLSSDFRGALAENHVMQALVSSGLSPFYWMPTDKVGSGEIDFIVQTRRAEVVPIEVKSGRNVATKSLRSLMAQGRAPFAIRLSENNFGKSEGADGTRLRSLPLYAAFTICDLIA